MQVGLRIHTNVAMLALYNSNSTYIKSNQIESNSQVKFIAVERPNNNE